MSSTHNKVNLKNVDAILKKYPDWKKGLVKRHHKFVEAYLTLNGDVRMVGLKYTFSYEDMLSIFLRIERCLIDFSKEKELLLKSTKPTSNLLDSSKTLEKERLEKERLEKKKKEEEEKKRLETLHLQELKRQEELRKQEEERIRQEELRLQEIRLQEQKRHEEIRLQELKREEELKKQEEEKRKKKEKLKNALSNLDDKTQDVFFFVLEKSKSVNVHEVYPKRLAEIVESLLETNDLNSTAEQLGMRREHLVARVKGRNRPRKPCEQGAMFYLNQNGLNKNNQETA